MKRTFLPSAFRTSKLRRAGSVALASACIALIVPHLHAQTAPASQVWKSIGPDGGDARSLAADPRDPKHLYLGTLSSWMYETKDAGKSWHRLARLGKGDDLAVDNIFVDSSDPKTIVAGVFQLDEHGGGIYISHDSGKTWTTAPDMDGQSVRALAQAPSNSKLYVAGTVAGVFRSVDGGRHWTKISPESTELHEVESVAIDPVDTNTMYAGTWHLPWKTTDGGAHWSNMKNGLIDDSDVFSIIIDPHTPSVMYASACSGIYKSETAGGLFQKVQGIPSTARRTRVLMQDPKHAAIVYAGTTEGLYKTADAGAHWSRLTGPDVIVNDVYVDPSDDQRLLIATDRSGVLASVDGGTTFTSANNGFSQRIVQTLLVDATDPKTLYAGVLNDKIYGGVFVSKDDGVSWQQQSDGLAGRDVFALAQGADGAVYAGTSNGIVKLVAGKWQASGNVVTHTSQRVAAREHGSKTAHATVHTPTHAPARTIESVHKAGSIEGRVYALDLGNTAWYAATVKGVYRSMDQGQSWEVAPLAPGDYHYLDALGSRVVAGQRNTLMVSDDDGKGWKSVSLPSGLSAVNALAISADNAVWVGGREGVFFSKDGGASWNSVKNLPLGGIDGLDYDAALKRVLVSSRNSTSIYGVDTSDTPWKYWQAGWRVHQVLQQGDRLVGASLFDGVVLEPKPDAKSEQAGVASPAPAPGVQ